MTGPKKNLAASVAARLLNRAKQTGDDFPTLLTGYCFATSRAISNLTEQR